MPIIDTLRALASQLIVLHHLAFYGPLSDAAHGLAPDLFDWLYDNARMAVQAFLVIGGFLVAATLAPGGVPAIEQPLGLVWRRYRRLAMPYLAALALAIACAALARTWVVMDSTPAFPSVPQLLAHALLLQNLLGYEALSAGIWYVAIDFQLYAMMVALLWLAPRIAPASGGCRYPAPALIAALAIASLFYFNRNAAWDDWALYFFGAYGLGASAFWASGRTRSMSWLAVMLAIGLAALMMDFRSRIAVALLVALLLGVSRSFGIAGRWPELRPLAFLGRISYSVFLVHYPVCLLVNAAFARFAPGNPIATALGLALAWSASVMAATLFYRHVELASGTWLAQKSTAAR